MAKFDPKKYSVGEDGEDSGSSANILDGSISSKGKSYKSSNINPNLFDPDKYATMGELSSGSTAIPKPKNNIFDVDSFLNTDDSGVKAAPLLPKIENVPTNYKDMLQDTGTNMVRGVNVKDKKVVTGTDYAWTKDTLMSGMAQADTNIMNVLRMAHKAASKATDMITPDWLYNPDKDLVNKALDKSVNYYENTSEDYKKGHDYTGIRGVLGGAIEALPASATAFMGLPAFGAVAGGGYAREAENDGANFLQQLAYGALGGMAEGITEKIPFENLKKVISGDLVDKGAKTLIAKYGKQAAGIAFEMATEFAQEAAVDPITDINKKYLYKPDMDINLKDEGSKMLQDGLGGIALSVLMMALGLPAHVTSHIIASKAIENKTKLDDEGLKNLTGHVAEDIANLTPEEQKQYTSNTPDVPKVDINALPNIIKDKINPIPTGAELSTVAPLKNDGNMFIPKTPQSSLNEAQNNNGAINIDSKATDLLPLPNFLKNKDSYSAINKLPKLKTESVNTEPQVKEESVNTKPQIKEEAAPKEEKKSRFVGMNYDSLSELSKEFEKDRKLKDDKIIESKYQDLIDLGIVNKYADGYYFNWHNGQEEVKKQNDGKFFKDDKPNQRNVDTEAPKEETKKKPETKPEVKTPTVEDKYPNELIDSKGAYVKNEDGKVSIHFKDVDKVPKPLLDKLKEHKFRFVSGTKTESNGVMNTRTGKVPMTKKVRVGNDSYHKKTSDPEILSLLHSIANEINDKVFTERDTRLKNEKEAEEAKKKEEAKGLEPVDMRSPKQIEKEAEEEKKKLPPVDSTYRLHKDAEDMSADELIAERKRIEKELEIPNLAEYDRKGLQSLYDEMTTLLSEMDVEDDVQQEEAPKEEKRLVTSDEMLEDIKAQVLKDTRVINAVKNSDKQNALAMIQRVLLDTKASILIKNMKISQKSPEQSKEYNSYMEQIKSVGINKGTDTLERIKEEIYNELNTKAPEKKQIESKYGFTIGDNVLNNDSIAGKAEGKVVGFDKEGYVHIRTSEQIREDGHNWVNDRYVKPEDLTKLDYEVNITKEPRNAKTKTKTKTETKIKGNKESQEIANQVKEWLKAKKKFTFSELQDVGDKAYNGSMSSGAYERKDLTDSMELGVNQYLLEQTELNLNTRDQKEAIRNLEKLQELLNLLPTQTTRNTEMEQYQQFSTPPTYAYAVSYFANMNKNDVVLEPSAGIGGLAVYAKIAGAEVVVNELSEKRMDKLKNMNFDKEFKENGEQLNNILPSDVKPTVVIMNPPFSSSAGRTSTNKTMNGAKHVEQALKRLEPNGRLVMIVGSGMADNVPSFKEWWKKIKAEYNVLLNVTIDGANYAKYGTTFDNNIIVIDKTGATTEKPIVGTLKDLKSLIEMEDMINDRASQGNRENEQAADKPSSKKNDGAGEDKNGQGTSIHSSANDGKGGKSGNSDNRPKGKPTKDNADTGKPDVSNSTNNSNETTEGNKSDGLKENIKSTSTESSGGNSTSANGEGSNDVKVEQKTEEEIAEEQVGKEDFGDSIYSDYIPKVKIEGSKPHLGVLSQSAAMGAVESPNTKYVPSLPKSVIETGALSIAQLEPIVYAGQAHSEILPNGERKGFFIGDGTGVGKGREIAGIILDNFNKGRKKAVWISKNADLYWDAIRDWKNIGQDGSEVKALASVKDGKIKHEKGILYATYGQIMQNLDIANGGEGVSVKKKDKGTRIDEIVNWLGKDFDGVIAFDEAHKMGNAIAIKGKRGKADPSITALAGIELQKRLPKARIVYVSATGATEISNLAYAERLGLWGEGTPFPNKLNFINKIAEGGLAAMELIARDMKSLGLYLARSLSYDGVGYENLVHDLTPEQTEIYNKIAEGWQKVLQNIEAALEVTEQKNNGLAVGRAKGAFWTANQRFFNQIVTSMQMPSVIERVKNDLAEGKAVVMQLVNTNEASTKRALAKAKEEETDLDDLDLSPKDILIRLIEKSFPINQYEEKEDEEGNKKFVPVLNSEGKPVVNPEAVKMKEKLIMELSFLKIPSNPIDIITDEFGTDMVAEMTGRTVRLLEVDGHKEQVSFTPKMKAAEVEAFQGDKKKIMIFSDAGGTGKSYHADNTAKNKRKRIHYLIQAGWRADNAVQGFGRTHRTNQASAPTYVLVTTNLKGQKRFISSIARRLDQLGALTKGQRQTGSQGLFSAKDNLESTEAFEALEIFYRTLANDKIEGLNGKEVFEKMGLVGKIISKEDGKILESPDLRDTPKFLNRILCLEAELQNKVFEAYGEVLDHVVDVAAKNGTLETGLENYKADKVVIKQKKTIRKEKVSGAATNYVELEASHKNRLLSTEKIMKQAENDPNFVSFYKNNKSGSIRAVFKTVSKTLSNGNVIEQYNLVGQVVKIPQKVSADDLNRVSSNNNWEKIDKDTAMLEWESALANAPEFRKEKIHLITGALLPIWDRLPTGLTKVIRVKTDKGEVLLGRIIQDSKIDETLRRLGAERDKENFDIKTVFKNVLEDGATAHLANGWKISRSRIAGEYRIELTGRDVSNFYRQLQEQGVVLEKIAYIYRFFIPTDKVKGLNTIKAITQYRPIVKVTSNGEESGNDYAKSGSNLQTKPFADGEETDIKSRRNIIGDLQKSLNIPFRNGRISGRKSILGIYKRSPEVIRTRLAEDMPVLAHEVGHHLDKLFGMREDIKTKKEYHDELRELGKDQSKDKAKQLTEGIAEFVRLYLTDNQKAKDEAPKFYDYFEYQIESDKQVYKALETFKNDYAKYSTAASTDRVKAAISVGEKEKKQYSFEKAYTQWIDELKPLQTFVKNIVGKTNLNVLNDPAAQAILFRGWQGKAIAAIKYGIRNDNNILVSKALKDILKPVSKDIENFRAYMVARRAAELTERGIETGLDKTDIENTIKRYGSGEFVKAFDELQEYNNALLDKLVKSGIMSAEQKEAIQELNKDYVPFYRVMDNNNQSGGTGRTFANLASPVKKIKGSGKTIIDPIESIVKNTYYFINMAERNNVGRSVVDLALEHQGNGKYVEKVAPKFNATSFEITEVQKALENYGADLSNIQNLEQILTVFRPLIQPSAKDNIVTVYRNGKKEMFQLDKDIYEAMLFLNTESTNILVKALAKPASLLRAGAVLDPNFITRNPVRDMFSAMVYSKYGYIPVIDTLRGLNHVIRRDETYQKFYESGAAGGALVSLDRDYLQNNLREIMGTRKVKDLINVPKHILNTLRAISEATEEATRVSEFSKGLKKEGDTLQGRQKAALAARDITLDFSRAGTIGKEVNKTNAFFNATLQGSDKMIREFRKHPFKFLFLAHVYIALPSILLWLLFHDDDRIKELPAYRKDLFWNIPTEKHIISIPKPFELGIIFGSGYERALDFMFDNDKYGMKEWISSFADGIAPNMLPTALVPAIENMTNYSFFRKQAIENMSDTNLPKEERYNSYTSTTAKNIGKLPTLLGFKEGLSPKKIDNAIAGYTGGLGKLGIQAADILQGDKGKVPSKGIENIPALKGFFTTPFSNSRTVNYFYDDLSLLESKYKAAVRNYKLSNELTSEEYTKYTSKHKNFVPDGIDPDEYNKLKAMRLIKGQLDDIKQQEDKVMNSTKYTPEQKKAIAQNADKLRIKLIKEAQNKK